MANLLDYLDWRGDLTLEQAPFNEVDNLILAELSFVDFRDIVPGLGEGDSVVLREAAEGFFAKFPEGEKSIWAFWCLPSFRRCCEKWRIPGGLET